MKKQLLCALLCTAMVMASSLPAFAAKTTTKKTTQTKQEEVLEEAPVEPSDDLVAAPIPFATLRFVDKNGKPVQGLSVSHPLTYIFTDNKGIGDLDLAAATNFAGFLKDIKIDWSKPVAFSATNTVNNETKKYNVRLSKDNVNELVWDKETPAQSVAKKKEKVQFRVIDQNGKAVPNAQFVLPPQDFLLPTNTSGKTWYYGKAFEKYNVGLSYTDSKGNDQYVTKVVTIRDKHLKNGKMSITFQVNV